MKLSVIKDLLNTFEYLGANDWKPEDESNDFSSFLSHRAGTINIKTAYAMALEYQKESKIISEIEQKLTRKKKVCFSLLFNADKKEYRIVFDKDTQKYLFEEFEVSSNKRGYVTKSEFPASKVSDVIKLAKRYIPMFAGYRTRMRKQIMVKGKSKTVFISGLLIFDRRLQDYNMM